MKQKKETAREQDRQKQNKKWKKNSRPKKFHSLKHQISVLFICLLLLSIFIDYTDQWSFSGEILCIKKSGSAGRSKKCSFSDESG